MINITYLEVYILMMELFFLRIKRFATPWFSISIIRYVLIQE